MQSATHRRRLPAAWLKATLVLGLSIGSGTASAIFEPQPGPFPREGECNRDDPALIQAAQSIGFDHNIGPGSLKTLPVPEPSNLSDFVANRSAAIRLGKALFWDMKVGSDGIQACASCHYRAGVDPRSRNQMSPSGKNSSDLSFTHGPNKQLTAELFPFRLLADAQDRSSTVLRDTNDVVSSQGVLLRQFLGTTPGATNDNGSVLTDTVFQVGGINVRRAEPRNTPSVINAVFNHRQFWDGRADNIFNGVNEWGARDPNARVVKVTSNGQLVWQTVRLDNASLASQAVAPPLSDTEMGFVARPFRDVGKRLASARPLRQQAIHGNDSVLGPFRHSSGRGLDTTYGALVQRAFKDRWWNSSKIVVVDTATGAVSFAAKPNRALYANEYTLTEYNFSLFFGLALQLYEATLVSDDAPIDRHFDSLAAGGTGTLNGLQLQGMQLFEAAGCSDCHSGPEFSGATVRTLATGFDNPEVSPAFQPPEQIERMFIGSCEVAIYDQGFYNIGVRGFDEDPGLDVNDPFGNPLSIAKLLTLNPSSVPSQELLSFTYPSLMQLGQIPAIQQGERVSITGAFKMPTLRNIALTAPYFHNGGQLTLRQVVEFYNRGGAFHDYVSADNVPQDRFMDLVIGRLELTEDEIDLMVSFMETLTDARVVQQKAPFDHPELWVPNGHSGNEFSVVPNADGEAVTQFLHIPAVGANGGPLPAGFLE